MTEDCRTWRERLGAYALDQLEPWERAATEAHLEGCAECRHELQALAPVAAVLERADPDRLSDVPAPPPDLGERIARRVASERRSRRRTRLRIGFGLAGAAAAAAAAAAAIAVFAGGSGEPASETVAFRTVPPGASAQATLTPSPWGSDVSVQVRGFRPGTMCQIWLRRADGSRVPAGSFRYVYDGESDGAELSSGVAPDEAVAIGLRAGSKTFVAPLPSHGTGAALNETTKHEEA